MSSINDADLSSINSTLNGICDGVEIPLEKAQFQQIKIPVPIIGDIDIDFPSKASTITVKPPGCGNAVFFKENFCRVGRY